jgi:hydroxymethylglutaryl-CoA lyase
MTKETKGYAFNLVEVGPRDGFQNVKEYIPASVKLKIIDGIIAAGYRKIQVTSFVSPKAIPQMRDANEVARTAIANHPQVAFSALVPNLIGARTAFAAGLKEINPVISLSESHNMANIRRTVAQSTQEIQTIVEELPEVKVSLDIATAFACPFEGMMPMASLLKLIGTMHKLGIRSFTLCDTIGMANPIQVEAVFAKVCSEYPGCTFGAHIHDTRNMGILNSYIALQSGATSIQSTLGGLGGCPFAPGASGNTSSEDLVFMLNQSGYDTDIDFEQLLQVAKYQRSVVKGNYSGHHIDIEVPYNLHSRN